MLVVARGPPRLFQVDSLNSRTRCLRPAARPAHLTSPCAVRSPPPSLPAATRMTARVVEVRADCMGEEATQVDHPWSGTWYRICSASLRLHERSSLQASRSSLRLLPRPLSSPIKAHPSTRKLSVVRSRRWLSRRSSLCGQQWERTRRASYKSSPSSQEAFADTVTGAHCPWRPQSRPPEGGAEGSGEQVSLPRHAALGCAALQQAGSRCMAVSSQDAARAGCPAES
eukprot:750541-Hanusia_phi.AAC.3